ncbi:MAG: hypothetical protein QXL57_09095, partial [Candidatus Bathyarchaeia archaeon]
HTPYKNAKPKAPNHAKHKHFYACHSTSTASMAKCNTFFEAATELSTGRFRRKQLETGLSADVLHPRLEAEDAALYPYGHGVWHSPMWLSPLVQLV